MQRAEREVAEARAGVEAEQARYASRAAALAESAAQQAADARVLEAAKTAWAEGEAERRAAASLLEEARSEAARVKVSAYSSICHASSTLPFQYHPVKQA